MVIKNIIDIIEFIHSHGIKIFFEKNGSKTLYSPRIDGPSIISLVRTHKAEFLSPVKNSGHIPKLVRESDVFFVTSFAQERLRMLGNIAGRCTIMKNDCSDGLSIARSRSCSSGSYFARLAYKSSSSERTDGELFSIFGYRWIGTPHVARMVGKIFA